ncbi:MAG: sugar kinase [Rhizobiales bacterium]|nr:sugar kinase [Hyphomicrobiales bacterium]MBI3673471.1 sugar kinase [Hyphomicrobiales bacterium]
MAAGQPPDIVALGEPLYELNQQPDGRFLGGFGGDTSNVAIAAARLGARAAYVSRVGADMFGDALRDLWRAEGVDASAVGVDPTAPTGLYFVTHDTNGHHFTYRRAGSAASLMTPADVPEGLIASAKFLHVSGISLAIGASAAETVRHAAAVARRAKVRISFDTNFRPQLWGAEAAWPEIGRLAASAHILKTSVEDSAALFGGRTPADIARRFLDLGSVIVLATLGAEGVHVATADTHETIPGRPVIAVDATGAGDAFTGALVAELSRGADLHAAVRFANTAAALSTLGYGAIAPLPRRSEVDRAV